MISLPAFFALFILIGVIFVIAAIGDNSSLGSVSVNKNASATTLGVQQQSETHEYTLVAEETTLEIAPGVRVDAWTYNGTIPGPTLTATEGDRVIVHFINKTPLPHTVHFHGDHPSTARWCI